MLVCHRFCDVETLNAVKQCGRRGYLSPRLGAGCSLFSVSHKLDAGLRRRHRLTFEIYGNVCIYYFCFFLYSKRPFSVNKPTHVVSSEHFPSDRCLISFFVHVHPAEACLTPCFLQPSLSPSAPDGLQKQQIHEAGRATSCLRGNYSCFETLV